jgi:hypothetical protein
MVDPISQEERPNIEKLLKNEGLLDEEKNNEKIKDPKNKIKICLTW